VGTIVVALRNGLALAHAADPEQIDARVIERAGRGAHLAGERPIQPAIAMSG
jgi:hypothetical protein